MDDLISRQAAIDAIRGYLVGKRCPDDGTLTCRLIENEVINKLPTIHHEHGTNLAEVGTDVPDNNVGELISRQAAIDAVEESRRLNHHEDGKEACAHEYEHRHFLKILRDLPTVEPQIVRCKDCKHWIPYDWMFSEEWQSKNIADYPEDEIGCALSDMAMKASDFCSRAERREVTT